MSRLAKFALVICSGIAGAALVVAAFKFSFLNWIVDGPGWLVNRFVSIDLHEGEGAFGFLAAIFLSWLWTSIATLLALLAARRLVERFRSRSHGS